MAPEPATGEGALAPAASMPFATMVGVDALNARPDEVRGRLTWRPEVCTTGGVMHGGALMTLADSLGAVCAVLNLPAGAWTGTIESKTNFFRAVRGGFVEGVSRPLHVGRTTIVVQTDVFDADGRRVAQVTQTQAVLSRSSE
jgi:1,4-dihydroxy-2-naphthoyl-CoA hydrolase